MPPTYSNFNLHILYGLCNENTTAAIKEYQVVCRVEDWARFSRSKKYSVFCRHE